MACAIICNLHPFGRSDDRCALATADRFARHVMRQVMFLALKRRAEAYYAGIELVSNMHHGAFFR